MTADLEFRVYGLPAPQGSKSVNPRSGRMFEQGQKKLTPWRAAVKQAASTAASMTGTERFDGPVAVTIVFTFKRLKSHYGTGRNAAVLRPDAPLYKHTKPDVDKLERATFDAITAAGVWADDSRVAHTSIDKVYGDVEGAHIRIRALQETA